MMVGSAHASSFVTIEAKPVKSSPSIIVIGEAKSFVTMLEAPKAAPLDKDAPIIPLAFPLPEDRQSTVISPSVVAFESITPDIAYEKVAAIKPDHAAPKPFNMSTPMVMRGGIIGDAFSTPSAPESAPAEAAAMPASSRHGAKSRKEPPQEEAAPAPAPPPPANLPKVGEQL